MMLGSSCSPCCGYRCYVPIDVNDPCVCPSTGSRYPFAQSAVVNIRNLMHADGVSEINANLLHDIQNTPLNLVGDVTPTFTEYFLLPFCECSSPSPSALICNTTCVGTVCGLPLYGSGSFPRMIADCNGEIQFSNSSDTFVNKFAACQTGTETFADSFQWGLKMNRNQFGGQPSSAEYDIVWCDERGNAASRATFPLVGEILLDVQYLSRIPVQGMLEVLFTR